MKNRMLLMSLVMVSTALVHAGEDSQSSSIESMLNTIVTINFKDTPIEDAISVIAETSGLNIVISSSVSGTVTASMKDVPLAEALNNLLAVQNAGFIATERVIRVVPISEIAMTRESRDSRIYRITYADTQQVADALRSFISKDGEIAVNIGTGNIIVTDTESKLQAIGTFLEEIDRQTSQILVEVKIYDITSKDRLSLGVEWGAGTNTVFTDGQAVGGNRDPFIQGRNASSINKTPGSDSSIRFGVLNNNIDVNFLLRAEQENICATLLANPRILVLDKNRATFKSVSEIPYQELQETSAGGSIGATAFREVGVSLDVIPQITRNGLIRLRIIPEFSLATGSVTVGGFQVTSPQPVVDTRKADTMLLIEDGSTIVLGGLRKKEISHQVNKVPLLGDIPLIGGLFRSSAEETVNHELVVFITPRIVVEPTLNSSENAILDDMKNQFCTPQCQDPLTDRCNPTACNSSEK